MTRFSGRLQWHPSHNRLAGLREEKRASGSVVLDLTESNPTRAGFSYDSRMLGALASAEGLRYDPASCGLTSARKAVAEYYEARGVAVDPSHVLLTASTSEAYSYIFQLLADPGDEILSPRPSYPLFEFLAGLSSVTMRQYPLRYDGVWHLDFPALERLVTPRSRAIVVVNPNNPTGSFLKRDELQRLEDFALRHELAIISDEVFCDYGFGPDQERVTTLVGDRRVLTFSMSGLSKVAGLPQLKLGWIVASGPGYEQALEALDLIADTFLSVATPVQIALPELLSSGASIQQQIAARTAANLRSLQHGLDGSAGSVLNVEGGWYGVVRVPATHSEEEWALRLLRERDVLVQPGFYFDFETEAFLVLSLLTAPETFEEGLRRLRAFL